MKARAGQHSGPPQIHGGPCSWTHGDGDETLQPVVLTKPSPCPGRQLSPSQRDRWPDAAQPAAWLNDAAVLRQS